MVVVGAIAVAPLGWTGLTGFLGRYSGPVWPQAASTPAATNATAVFSAMEGFTDRITY